jgi:putative transposase
VLEALEQTLTLRQPALGSSTPTGAVTSPAPPAASVSTKLVPYPASASRAIPTTTSRPKAGWSTLKTELLPHGEAFASLEEALLEVAHYLDTYFNLDHRHSALGYRSPHQFEQYLKLNLP